MQPVKSVIRSIDCVGIKRRVRGSLSGARSHLLETARPQISATLPRTVIGQPYRCFAMPGSSHVGRSRACQIMSDGFLPVRVHPRCSPPPRYSARIGTGVFPLPRHPPPAPPAALRGTGPLASFIHSLVNCPREVGAGVTNVCRGLGGLQASEISRSRRGGGWKRTCGSSRGESEGLSLGVYAAGMA